MFTEKEFVQTVVNLVNENPDFIYKQTEGRCTYLPLGKQPGCLFGQALTKLGFDRVKLQEFDETENATTIGEILDIFNFSEGIIRWSSEMQSLQDTGDAWGKCLKQTGMPNESI